MFSIVFCLYVYYIQIEGLVNPLFDIFLDFIPNFGYGIIRVDDVVRHLEVASIADARGVGFDLWYEAGDEGVWGLSAYSSFDHLGVFV